MRQNNNALTTENMGEKLQFFSLFINWDKIVSVYARETTPEQKKALAQVYQELTGDNIEHRLAHLDSATAAKI